MKSGNESPTVCSPLVLVTVRVHATATGNCWYCLGDRPQTQTVWVCSNLDCVSTLLLDLGATTCGHSWTFISQGQLPLSPVRQWPPGWQHMRLFLSLRWPQEPLSESATALHQALCVPCKSEGAIQQPCIHRKTGKEKVCQAFAKMNVLTTHKDTIYSILPPMCRRSLDIAMGKNIMASNFQGIQSCV